jgi:hypothetical protein
LEDTPSFFRSQPLIAFTHFILHCRHNYWVDIPHYQIKTSSVKDSFETISRNIGALQVLRETQPDVITCEAGRALTFDVLLDSRDGSRSFYRSWHTSLEKNGDWNEFTKTWLLAHQVYGGGNLPKGSSGFDTEALRQMRM